MMKQLIFCVLGYALCLFPNLLPATAWAVQVKDYGVEVAPTPGSIHWMNDSRLVFKGLVTIQETRPTQYPGKRVGKFATLDLKTGKIEWYGEFTGQLCVDGEQVAYSNDNRDIRAPSEKDRFWLVRGMPPNLSSRETSREELQGFDFNLACRASSELPPMPARTKGKLIKRLMPEHGYVKMEKQGEKFLAPIYPARLYRQNQPQEAGIPLAIERFEGEEINPTWSYYPFKGAYLITKEQRVVPAPEGWAYKSWWFSPDGSIELATQATRQSAKEYFWVPYIPTKVGFLTSHPRDYRSSLLRGNLGDAGIYRYDANGKHQKLVVGQIGPWVVSPDGCKLAAGLDDRKNVPGTGLYRLHVIELCK